jgi:hypothetical protein
MKGLSMQRFRIDLLLTDNFYLYAENETEAKIEASRRIRVGAWPFDHSVRPQDFEIQSIKKG